MPPARCCVCWRVLPTRPRERPAACGTLLTAHAAPTAPQHPSAPAPVQRQWGTPSFNLEHQHKASMLCNAEHRKDVTGPERGVSSPELCVNHSRQCSAAALPSDSMLAATNARNAQVMQCEHAECSQCAATMHRMGEMQDPTSAASARAACPSSVLLICASRAALASPKLPYSPPKLPAAAGSAAAAAAAAAAAVAAAVALGLPWSTPPEPARDAAARWRLSPAPGAPASRASRVEM